MTLKRLWTLNATLRPTQVRVAFKVRRFSPSLPDSPRQKAKPPERGSGGAAQTTMSLRTDYFFAGVAAFFFGGADFRRQ
jgi:hypothetical protein